MGRKYELSSQNSLKNLLFKVSIQYARSSGGHFCGGSILDKSRVLTAMHCIYGRTAEQVQVQYGVVDNRERANVVNVSKIIVHDKYGVGGMIANDIAILELAADMKLDGVNATPVSLPSSFPSTSPSINAQLCGWGYRTVSQNLHLAGISLLFKYF